MVEASVGPKVGVCVRRCVSKGGVVCVVCVCSAGQCGGVCGPSPTVCGPGVMGPGVGSGQGECGGGVECNGSQQKWGMSFKASISVNSQSGGSPHEGSG